MTKAKADLLLHPIRLRLITALAGRHLTTRQLAEVVPEVPQATLYRHMSQLVKANVVEVSQERPVRGVVEKVYTLREGMATVSAKDFAKATPDDHLRYFTSFAATVLSQFAHYLHAAPNRDFIKDGVGYRQVALYLTEEEFIEMATKLNATLAPFVANEPTPQRKRRLLTTVFMPDSMTTDG